MSTGIGLLFGFVGGAGATNAKGLDVAVRNSSQFIKAATSYDRVLTKIANGAYKNLAGAAGARAITVRMLQNAWQNSVSKTAWTSFLKNIKYIIIQNILNTIKV